MSTFLIFAGAAGVYVLLVLARPLHRCPRCKGTRRARAHFGFGRMGKCPRCRGRGMAMRFGARQVHGFFQTVRAERLNRGHDNEEDD